MKIPRRKAMLAMLTTGIGGLLRGKPCATEEHHLTGGALYEGSRSCTLAEPWTFRTVTVYRGALSADEIAEIHRCQLQQLQQLDDGVKVDYLIAQEDADEQAKSA